MNLKLISDRHDKACDYAEYNLAYVTPPAHRDRGELLALLKKIVPLIPTFDHGLERNLPISNFDYLKDQI